MSFRRHFDDHLNVYIVLELCANKVSFWGDLDPEWFVEEEKETAGGLDQVLLVAGFECFGVFAWEAHCA